MTRDEVENAIAHVLGARTAGIMIDGGVNLPERLNIAALKAFREDWPTDGKLDRIRGALLMLSKEGEFSFDEE